MELSIFVQCLNPQNYAASANGCSNDSIGIGNGIVLDTNGGCYIRFVKQEKAHSAQPAKWAFN